MTLRPCPHEEEVRQLLQAGHWPHSVAPELRSHVEACRSCRDLVLLTQAFRSARAASSAAAQLPPPGVIWWRAQLRRRNAAVERIQRPLVGAQIFALAITLVIAAGFAVSAAKDGFRPLASMAGWLGSLTQSSAFHFQSLWPSAFAKSDMNLSFLVPGVVMLALLGGVVVYLASEKQ
jgi:hypothetical protein